MNDEKKTTILYHNPRLAHEIHEHVVKFLGLRNKKYSSFLSLAKLLAEANNIKFITRPVKKRGESK